MVEQQSALQPENILLNYMNEEGLEAFVLLRAFKKEIHAIKNRSRLNKTIDFNDYGKVLYIGEGTPGESLVEYLQASYGQISYL